MPEDEPRLRLVAPDERAPDPPEPVERPSAVEGEFDEVDDDFDDDRRVAWVTGILPLCIGIAILAVGLALSLRLLMDGSSDDASSDSGSDAEVTAPADPSGASVQPTLAPLASTTIAPPSTTSESIPGETSSPAPVGEPGLIGVPVIGGATTPNPVEPPPATTGSARLRIFNGYAPGQTLDVWEVASGTPVRYGSIAFAELKEMVIGGQRLPGGVAVNLRFVVPGGDPMAAKGQSGTWWWDFTPPDGSSNTIFLSDNDGMRVVRADNNRALGEVPAGGVHVVPVVFHLTLQGTREKAWSADGFGCIGHTTTDKQEFDVVVGTALRLTAAADTTCATAVSDAAVLDRSTAVAVVGVESATDFAHLVIVPFD